MKTAFKVLLLFLILFLFRLPYVYNTAILSAILSILYYAFSRGSVPLAQFNNRYVVTLLVSTLLVSLAYYIVIVAHETYGYTLHQKRFYLMLFMMFAAILAFPILLEGKEDCAFEEIAKLVALCYATQGAIHLTGFIYHPFGEMITHITGNYEAYMNSWNQNIKYYRYFALCGSIFFELPGAYGAASILIFRLLLVKGQKAISGYRAIIVLFFVFAGICLSGRTGFVGFFMGVLLYIIFVPKNFPNWDKNLYRWGTTAFVLLIAYFVFLTPGKREEFEKDLFPFAFEAYYNWRDHGTFRTASSDFTKEVQYFPLRAETLLYGHGCPVMFAPGYYHSDAGYIEILVFGGIFLLLFMSIYQFMYFYQPMSIANARSTPESKRDFYCFLFMFIYIFIIEIKGTALGTQHYTMVIYCIAGLSYLVRHNYRLEHGIARN